MFIDTHCHLSDEYYESIDNIIEENEKSGIEKIIISGCEKKEIESSLNYIKKYECVFATLGYHPQEAGIVSSSALKDLERIISSNKKIVGIGEIGLDYHYGKENMEQQKKLFEDQLKLAEKMKLPVVIHTRDATKDTIEILKKYNLKGIIHCFSGSLETAQEYIKLGYKLGIGGVVTFKNSKLANVIREISLDDIVFETDSPYLTPEPYRGKINSSKYINIIAQKIAEIKESSIDEVSKYTLKNTYDLFDLK